MLSILLKVTQMVKARSSVKPISLIPKVTLTTAKQLLLLSMKILEIPRSLLESTQIISLIFESLPLVFLPFGFKFSHVCLSLLKIQGSVIFCRKWMIS